MEDGSGVIVGRRLALAALLAAAARSSFAERLYRIGVLGVEPFDPSESATFVELARRGYVVGRNLQVVIKNAGNDTGLLNAMAAELAADKVDVIVSICSNACAWAARRATSTIPIVMVGSGEIVEDGLVKSLAKPGGNLTGNTAPGPELSIKRMQLLMEALPARASVGVLIYEPLMSGLGTRRAVDALDGLAKAAKRALVVAAVRKVDRGDDLDNSLQFLKAREVAGVLVRSWATIGASAERVGGLFLRYRMASIMEWGGFADVGVLMTYAEATGDPERRVASFIDRIFKGARPSDLPIEQGTRFELAINVKTAAALDIQIPNSLLLRADTLIR